MHVRTPSVGTLGGLQTAPVVVKGPRREWRKPKPMMNGLKKSDEAVRPVRAANKGARASAESPEERASTKGNPDCQSTYVDAPCSARRISNNFCGMRSGTVVCPASQMQHSCATDPYGVRGSEPNRAGGMLDSPTCFFGFPDPVSLTFCPYVVFRPNRTIRDHPRITASNRHPRSPVFQFRTAHFSSKQLFPSSGSRHRRPVTFLLDRQRPDDARHLVRQCDGD